MNQEDIKRWLTEGATIYYFYLSGGIAISHPDVEGYDGVQWLSFTMFDWFKKEGLVDMTGKGNSTLIRNEKYQSYTWVKKDKENE